MVYILFATLWKLLLIFEFDTDTEVSEPTQLQKLKILNKRPVNLFFYFFLFNFLCPNELGIILSVKMLSSRCPVQALSKDDEKPPMNLQ